MKFNKDFLIGIAFIAFFVGGAVEAVGKTYQGGIYPWWLPLEMFLALLFPFLCGFGAGKNNK